MITDVLIGFQAQETPHDRDARALNILTQTVRPEWLIPIRAPRSPQGAEVPCRVRRCGREVARESFCSGHATRWDWMGRPTADLFAATTTWVVYEAHALPKCQVDWCRYGLRRPEHLCPEHARAWREAGRPDRGSWAALQPEQDPGPTAITCALPHCDLLSDAWPGVDAAYCRVHLRRWERAGRLPEAAFEAGVMNYGDPMHAFRRLPRLLQLQLQYALQRASDLGYSTGSFSAGSLVRLLEKADAHSLLQRDIDGWYEVFEELKPGWRDLDNMRAFLRFAHLELHDLIDGIGWENEYPRDVWQLHRLGFVTTTAARNIHFDDITQPWLRDLAKRWVHWRLVVEERAIGTVLSDATALRRLSSFLHQGGLAAHSLRQLTRPVLEGYLAWLHEQQSMGQATIRDTVSTTAVFLQALRLHEDWAPDLPRTAVIYSSDYPRMEPLRGRGLSTHIMVQVRDALPSWANTGGRFLTQLMLATGLRIGDACALPYDPLTFDRDGNSYVRYWNTKSSREGYVPISQATLDLIRDQQTVTAERYPVATRKYLSTPAPRALPHAGLRLTPAEHHNPDGARPFPTGTYNHQLRVFVTDHLIADEAGRPAHITSHMWRHTFATQLVNRGVRLEVIRQLLDHSTMEMSAHYARLMDTTVRAEWEAGRGAEVDEYAHLIPRDVEWANRARTALPNGHCGLPRQQSCDHSNKCLSCPVFITTRQDLGVHEEQRRRTLTLIQVFEQAGQTSLAQRNQTVLAHLDQRIAEIARQQDPTGPHGG